MTSIIKVDQIQTAAGATPTAADLGINVAGTVLQVKTASINSVATYSNSASSSEIAGLGITFTPKFSNSLLVFHCLITYSTENNGSGNAILMRKDGETVSMSTGASAANCWFGLDNNWGQANSVGMLMNAVGVWSQGAGSTSASTYTIIHYGVGGTTPLTINKSNNNGLRGVSTFSITEYAQ
jgi:hypothetical protein